MIGLQRPLCYHVNLNLEMSKVEYSEITKKVIEFREERNWKQFHKIKDLLLGLNIEVSELQELLLWKSDSEIDSIDKEKIEDELADIFYNYGEERRSRQIAKAIVEARAKNRITSSIILAELVGRVKKFRGKIHPATQVFQALRIAVNCELDNLKEALNVMPSLLLPGGRIVVMSYHSLEDRIVKQAFKSMDAENILNIITKKVVIAQRDEQKTNPRSRSAKLRCAEKPA